MRSNDIQTYPYNAHSYDLRAVKQYSGAYVP